MFVFIRCFIFGGLCLLCFDLKASSSREGQHCVWKTIHTVWLLKSEIWKKCHVKWNDWSCLVWCIKHTRENCYLSSKGYLLLSFLCVHYLLLGLLFFRICFVFIFFCICFALTQSPCCTKASVYSDAVYDHLFCWQCECQICLPPNPVYQDSIAKQWLNTYWIIQMGWFIEVDFSYLVMCPHSRDA